VISEDSLDAENENYAGSRQAIQEDGFRED
jgi:hypothetical protein